GDLVEGLAGRVVDGGAERADVGRDVRGQQEGGVAAGHQQGHGRLGEGAVLQLVDADVGGEVVDPVERLAEGVGVRLGRRDAHEERAGQAGSGGDGDAVQVA